MHLPILGVCIATFLAIVASGAFADMVPVMQLAVIAVICSVGAVMTMIRQAQQGNGFDIVPALWAMALIILAGSWTFRTEGRLFALSLLERPVAAERETGTMRHEVMLMRAWDGHFRAVASIDGAPVGLLIDTGASRVLLRYDDAQRAGIAASQLNYNLPVTTASGRTFVAPIVLDRIEIGGIVVDDVEAAVAEPGQLHSSLLGMSFLDDLHETVIRSDRIILRK
ncbi:MAG: retropepsin-like aspartic protease family protein [Rubricella sp.]